VTTKALFKNKLIIRLTLQATAFRVPALAGGGGTLNAVAPRLQVLSIGLLDMAN
jgi:hypothetical protein